MPQVPTIGRQVIALVDPLHNNGADVAPATIVRAWGEHPRGGHTVNIKVTHDGEGCSAWLTSIRLVETEAEAREAHAAGERVAFWPAIVVR